MQATTYVPAIESGYEQVHAVDIFCIPAKFSHTALAGTDPAVLQGDLQAVILYMGAPKPSIGVFNLQLV